MFDLITERGVIRSSIICTIALSAFGIGFGLYSGSYSIMFDGIFNLIDTTMGLVTLLVVNLIASYSQTTKFSRKLKDRFSMGLWHLEPMVLLLNGTTLMSVALYALVNAIASLLSGGRELEFGPAVTYAVVTMIACSAIAIGMSRANRSIGSQFIQLDIKSWIMSAGISSALVIAFGLGLFVQGTEWEWISPYIDPTVLAIVCAIIIPIPVSTLRTALADFFLVTPVELKQHVDSVAEAVVSKYNFITHRSYVMRSGRSREIELYFIVPPDLPLRSIAEWDTLRDEISDALGGAGPDRWLVIMFTESLEWAE